MRKVTEYLLSSRHPVGRHKRRFFQSLGFKSSKPEALVTALRQLAVDGTVSDAMDSAFGRRYLVDGALHAPGGSSAPVRSVWLMAPGSTEPHFVTAFPLARLRRRRWRK